jgi:hypothetical protein
MFVLSYLHSIFYITTALINKPYKQEKSICVQYTQVAQSTIQCVFSHHFVPVEQLQRVGHRISFSLEQFISYILQLLDIHQSECLILSNRGLTPGSILRQILLARSQKKTPYSPLWYAKTVTQNQQPSLIAHVENYSGVRAHKHICIITQLKKQHRTQYIRISLIL